jgi:Bacterial regulatory proteins, gntR family
VVVLSKTEQVWRHLATGAIERGQRRWPSVTALAGELGMGVSTVHRALSHPVEIGAVDVLGGGGVRVVDPGRLLIVWAGQRRLRRDEVERFRVPGSAPVVERSIGSRGAVLGGFGAVVAALGGNTIADYETVLVYGEPRVTRRRIADPDPGRVTEVVVLEPDPLLAQYGRVTPLTQAWVDLFNLPGWQAARFVHHLLTRVVTDVAVDTGLLSA